MLDGRVDAFARHAISGWAVDTDRPDKRSEVVIVVDGYIRGSVSADQPRPDLAELGMLGDGAHGFSYAFDPPLSPMRAYEVSVCHVGTDLPLRLGRFTIAAETGRAADALRPLIVTTSGQPGFITLMRSLAADPAMVAANHHDYGIKLVTYYARAAEVLMTPSGRAPLGQAAEDGVYVLGPNPFHAAEYEALMPDPRQLYDFFQKRAAAPICAAFKAILTEFYNMLSVQQGRAEARYFAEQADLFDIARNFARLAFSDMREIVLLQDPRDAYCGYRALWSVSPAQALETLQRVRDRTVQLQREGRADTWFLRSEDLRLRPEATIAELSRFLDLDHVIAADPAAVQTAHATTDPAELGIGRWRVELDADEARSFEEEFGEYLRVFGYDVAQDPPA